MCPAEYSQDTGPLIVEGLFRIVRIDASLLIEAKVPDGPGIFSGLLTVGISLFRVTQPLEQISGLLKRVRIIQREYGRVPVYIGY